MPPKPRSQSKTRRRNSQKGGRASKLKRILDFNSAEIVGAGGYGIVVKHGPTRAFKLLKSLEACAALKKEATLQQKAATLLSRYLPEVYVPPVTYFTTEPTSYKGVTYLCGIEMELLTPPAGFSEQVHMLLGYNGDDIDTEWGMRMAEPVSATNPTRGFFASPETLELIWEYEHAQMTVERLAALMGRATRLLLDHGLVPIDLEWVWSGGKPCLIDFGLCESAGPHSPSPLQFLSQKGVRGLADDFYIPHEADRGYSEFVEAFLQ